LYGTADTAWVGRIGPEAIGAVSTSFFASWTLFAVGDILIAGVTALVSQSVGARRESEAARASITGLLLALILGIAVAAVGYLGSPALFRFLLDEPAVVEMGGDYLSLFSLLAPVFYLAFVAEAIFRSCGNSRTPMYVLLVGTVLNIVLDPIFIFGAGPIPRLEVRGAAIATVISEIVVLLIYGVLYARRMFPLELRFSRAFHEFSRRRALQILRIGTPPALIGVLFSAVYLILARISGAFGPPALAALGVVNRLESLNYLTATAMGMGVSAMVGQNLGARRVDRAAASAHRGAFLMTLPTGLVTAAFLLAAEPIVSVFTSDPAAVAESALFLRIVAVSQIFMGWELVYSHAFTGAGNTLPPMYISAITSIVRVPLAWWLAFPMGAGPAGIWWTISLTGIVRGTVLPAWFWRGRWKRIDLGIGVPHEVAPVGPDSPDG
jgi:putative MATE family efflux protein